MLREIEYMTPPLRVLLAKLGLDTHTVGVTVIAHALRDAGMEVIFTGLKQTAAAVAATAIQEDVDVVGVSSLSAAHMRHIPELARLLGEQGGADKLLIVGGVVPEEDQASLHEAGVARIFIMGASTQEIIDYLNDWRRQRDAAASV